MGFTGLDDLVLQVSTNGKQKRIPFHRIIQTGATSVAGRWHECFTTASGTGGTGVLTGTAGSGTAMTAAKAGALPIGPSVSPATRHVQRLTIYTPATTAVPGNVKLIDILYMYPSCTTLTTPTTLAQTEAKPTRMTANYSDIQIGAIVTAATGAANPLLTVTYTDQAGNTGKTATLAASANTMPVGSMLTASGAAVLGMPNAAHPVGVSGVQKIDSYAITSGSIAGTVCFILYREVASIPVLAANTASERDLNFDLPKIDDDACLTMIVQPGGALVASSVLAGELTTVWGG